MATAAPPRTGSPQQTTSTAPEPGASPTEAPQGAGDQQRVPGGLERMQLCQECRAWNSFSRWEVLYTLGILAVLLALTGLTVYAVVVHQVDSLCITSFVMICEVFAFYYLLVGVFCERPTEIGCLTITYILIAYTITVSYVMEPYHPVKLAELCVVWICLVPVVGLNVRFTFRFLKGSRVVTRITGKDADSDIKQGMIWMFRCRALLTFDLQLTSLTLLYSFHDEQVFHGVNYLVILSLGYLASLVYIIVGSLTMRLERLVLFVLFFILSFFQPAYVFYIITHCYVEIVTLAEAPELAADAVRSVVTVTVLGYCAVFLCGRILLVVSMERVQSMFGNKIGELMFNYSCLFPLQPASRTGDEPLLASTPPLEPEPTTAATYSTFGSRSPSNTP